MTNKNFYSLLDRPETQCSPAGESVYEWSYLDQVGTLKTDKKDVYEAIQSFKNSVDYKKKIEQGEIFENGTGIYMDTRKFDGDYGDVSEYFSNLASVLKSQINQNNGAVGGTSGNKTPSDVATSVKESGSDKSGSGAVAIGSEQQQGGDGK